jgi:antitoxin component YwqK of YwqJK toxin-antitoxin module
MNLKDGLQDGQTILYFENGQTNEVRSYKNGLKDGKWETYNKANIKIAEAWYLLDKKHGQWLIWDENGILRYEMHYHEGLKTGVWNIYNEKGERISTKDFTTH